EPLPHVERSTTHVLRAATPLITRDDGDPSASSTMAVPLLARGRVLGAMTFVATRPRGYAAGDVAFAEDLAARCAGAIDNARLYRDLGRELAERRRAEERLRESDEQLHLAFDAAHMGTWSWDVRSGGVRASWTDVLAGGAERTEFDGTFDDFLARFHPDDRAPLNKTLTRALAERGEYEVDVRLRSPGGTQWIATKGKVACDADGTPVRVVGVAMDVTERKRTAQRLAVQYETTRILAEGTPLEDVAPRILRAVCECLGWVYGALWRLDAEADVLRCVETWNTPGVEVPRFDAVTRAAAFPKGVGLPGRVWEGGEPLWIADVVRDANFPRAAIAAREGLHGAFAFPSAAARRSSGCSSSSARASCRRTRTCSR
ncbi:MAG TPA: GAF domain-containing protein, partial [Candidatus Binatia bacterium]|nr:GAF domain-containing protein [Candidatus Binatia bacterium]